MRRLLLLLAALAAVAPSVSAQETTTVILVRHAEKDVEPAGDPVLTAAGTERAATLAAELADRGIAGIIVSEYARTRLTAQPLAERLGIEPEVASVRAGLREHALGIAALIRSRYAGKTVLVVGHSNTLPAIIAALGAEVEPICDGTYGNLYVVTLREGERTAVTRRSYGAPDPADACAAAH